MRFNVVALTGGIGSGKSTVANVFSELGINIIDADSIAREIVRPGSPALQKIIARYSRSILTEEGKLNRAMLRNIIFQSCKEKNWLDDLLHPLINMRTEQLKKLTSSPYIIWVVPLLIENGLQHLADRVLVIDTEEIIQLQRTQRRDKISFNQVEKILSVQISRTQRLAYANDVIENNGTIEQMMERVAELHQSYLRLAAIG
ncbi:dephospho-CoA kinase [Candidatus Pantoea carbekii]|uniref:Dephospho-CoA kinase n=1 Tax=Candidatus Pantoea carbekii TaxID=1235990 RepID=U3U9E7_9GAMM|nr:dephospho-CoA kinase [Candidatus Pantoea carbekii]AKC31921.1 dephospho-CoA kinase CoaE [Candidatus Pantoea carbekii]BAO00438.1 hypothetical protein HHS_04680 [Candidatus Pantoea carbekii]